MKAIRLEKTSRTGVADLMKTTISIFRLPAALIACVLGVSGAASAQTALPRTLEGRPDLAGIWSNQWLTPMERPTGEEQLVLTRQQARALTERIKARNIENNPLDPELAVPDAASLAIVRGEFRSSLVVAPANGKLPFNDAGRAAARRYISGLDGPEQRMSTERCIGGVGWAPLQIRSANMLHRFVQAPGYVVMHTEAYDDTRIVALDGVYRPKGVEPVGGDSIGRWDGDVLEVETKNLAPRHSTHGIVTVTSPDAVILERFDMVSPDEIVYRYTVTDPAYYAEPWTVEYSLVRTTQPMYEFACHEGNYSMTGMLKGARIEEE